MNNQIYLNGITVEQLAEALKPLLKSETTKESQQLENDLLTRKEACKLLSINLTTLWKHTKSGKLHNFGIGKRVFYNRKQLLDAVKPINH
jgi:hypothetical protein